MTSEAIVVPRTGRMAPEHYSALYTTYLQPLLRFAWLLCGDRHQAEDVVAEAFAKVLPQWRRGRVYEPYAYLRRAVVNEATTKGSARAARDAGGTPVKSHTARGLERLRVELEEG